MKYTAGNIVPDGLQVPRKRRFLYFLGIARVSFTHAWKEKSFLNPNSATVAKEFKQINYRYLSSSGTEAS